MFQLRERANRLVRSSCRLVATTAFARLPRDRRTRRWDLRWRELLTGLRQLVSIVVEPAHLTVRHHILKDVVGLILADGAASIGSMTSAIAQS